MATFTIDQWIAKMDQRIREASKEKLMVACIQNTVSQYVPRIFEQGIKSDGEQIGKYSEKEFVLYVKPDGSVPGSPKKVTENFFQPFNQSQRDKRGGKKGYFGKLYPFGYRQFKDDIGREHNFVNLVLFGELKSDAASVFLVKKANGFNYELKKEINGKKKEWMETKYGKIFNLTDKERIDFIACYKKEVLNKLTK